MILAGKKKQTVCGMRRLYGCLSTIVSSRLHLLFFGRNHLVPGIGRGSKIEYFLSRFGLVTAGTTDNLDLPRLTEAVEWALNGPPQQ